MSAENLSPAELKKLKNKQRKKAKQEAMRRERQRQEEQHKQPQKPKSQDTDLDGPKEEELVPDKLAKVLHVLAAHFPLVSKFKWQKYLTERSNREILVETDDT